MRLRLQDLVLLCALAQVSPGLCQTPPAPKTSTGEDPSPNQPGPAPQTMPGTAGSTASVSGRWALLIGVDDYHWARKLEYCGADMRALRERLVASGFPDGHVYLLHDKADENKYRPMKSSVEEHLRLVLGLVEPNDLVLVAFSGHGVHLDGKSYLCPADAKLEEPASLVSVDLVYELLQKSRAAMKLLLVDACRNDPRPKGERSLTPSDGTRQFAAAMENPPQGILLLTSCAPDEIAHEDKDFGHGVFMHYLLQGLRGEADANHNGRVSLMELYLYANDQTKSYVAKKYFGSQRPALKGQIDDDFDLSQILSPAKQLTNGIGMRLVLIPSGSFLMGSPASQGSDDERPQHPVSISRPFYLSATEVTQGQYEAVMGQRPSWFSASGGGNAAVPGADTTNHPVEMVSYEEAVDFCRRLARREQMADGSYRLPTEAEWEYAARSGCQADPSLGDDPAALPGHAWFRPTARGATHPVATLKPNALGLYDMAGNVSEWCSDWYDERYYTQSPPSDPAGPAGPTARQARVLRGGSWIASERLSRFAQRHASDPRERVNCYGFRVVLDAAARHP